MEILTGLGVALTLMGAMDEAFLRPNDPLLAEILTDAFVELLGQRGIDKFSVSAMARWMRVTPSFVLNDYPRSRVLENVISCFGNRWVSWSLAMATEGSLPVRLPESPHEYLGVRAWSALQHLAEAEDLRGKPGARHRVEFVRDEELDWVSHRLLAMAPSCCPPPPGRMPAFMAAIDGLRLSLAAASPSISFAQATDAVEGLLRELMAHRSDCSGEAIAS